MTQFFADLVQFLVSFGTDPQNRSILVVQKDIGPALLCGSWPDAVLHLALIRHSVHLLSGFPSQFLRFIAKSSELENGTATPALELVP